MHMQYPNCGINITMNNLDNISVKTKIIEILCNNNLSILIMFSYFAITLIDCNAHNF